MDYLKKHGRTPRTFQAQPDVEVEPGLYRTDRLFPCVCGVRTGFRIGVEPGSLGAPCCSEECRTKAIVGLGLEQSAAGQTVDLGSFAQYAEDEVLDVLLTPPG